MFVFMFMFMFMFRFMFMMLCGRRAVGSRPEPALAHSRALQLVEGSSRAATAALALERATKWRQTSDFAARRSPVTRVDVVPAAAEVVVAVAAVEVEAVAVALGLGVQPLVVVEGEELVEAGLLAWAEELAA